MPPPAPLVMHTYNKALTTRTATYDADEITWGHKLKDVGGGTCTIGLTHPGLAESAFGPRRTGIVIAFADQATLLVDRVFTGHCSGIRLSEPEQIGVAYESPLWYLGKRRYPFSTSNDNTETVETNGRSSNFYRYWENASITEIVDDVLTAIMALPDSLPLTWTISGPAGSDLTVYKIARGENRSALDILQELSDGDTELAFDGYEFFDRLGEFGIFIRAFSGPPDPDDYAAILDKDCIVKEPDWTNDGPISTSLRASYEGAGGGLLVDKEFAPSIEKYGRIDGFATFPIPGRGELDIDDLTDLRLDSLAAARGKMERAPQKDVTVTVKPEAVFPEQDPKYFYVNNWINRQFRVVWDRWLPFQNIDNVCRVIGTKFYPEGADYLCDLDLEYINDEE